VDCVSFIFNFFLLLPVKSKNQPMKTKFFILVILFLGIGVISYAQTQTAAPTDKKDVPAQVAPEQGKTMDCPGHQSTTAKADCKFVDANMDGKCDNCGKTEKECKESCAPAAAPKKEGCGASCPMHKSCGESTGTTPATEPKK
jgi:hypothetical protein